MENCLAIVQFRIWEVIFIEVDTGINGMNEVLELVVYFVPNLQKPRMDISLFFMGLLS